MNEPRTQRETSSIRRFLAWLAPLVYMAIIFAVSSVAWNTSIPSAFPFRDKGVHFLEYLLLGFLCANAAVSSWPSPTTKRALATGALIAFFWGFADELHQAFVPGRDADVFDLLADALGAVAGASLRGLLSRCRHSLFF